MRNLKHHADNKLAHVVKVLVAKDSFPLPVRTADGAADRGDDCSIVNTFETMFNSIPPKMAVRQKQKPNQNHVKAKK
jgi:hypothetical protein